jgi:putative holliday junction resolvase
MQTTPSTILALDVGERRIGVALANTTARLARPLTTLDNSDHIIEDILNLVEQEGVQTIVVGLPRGLDGQTTAQTKTVEAFVKKLQTQVDLPFHWQDEALTSVQAEAELSHRNKVTNKADIDALAATLILEDFLQDHVGAQHV